MSAVAPILVTGASGFVGKPLCQRLAELGHPVRGAYRTLESAASTPTPFGSVALDLERLTLKEARDAMQGIHGVVHLAARVHVMRDTSTDPLSAFRQANVTATRTLAQAAAEAGVKRFVFVSSVKVHGEGRERAYTEHDAPAPQDAYGISKLEAENALWEVSAATGLEVTVVRPPLVYGPGVRANFLRLMKLVDRGWPLPFAWVRNARSLVGLPNLVDLLSLTLTHPKAPGEAFLVADGPPLSTGDLIRALARHLDRPARLFPLPLPAVLFRLPGMHRLSSVRQKLFGSLAVDTSKVKMLLNWSPGHTLDACLDQTVAWYRGR
jgi:nucleoside-diphosphate-sugar epimerase